MRILLTIGLILLVSSCTTLKPTEYVYKIVKAPIAQEVLPCFYNSVEDLMKNKNLKCIQVKDLEGWLVIHPDNLKKFLTKGVDKLIEIQNQSKP